MTDDTDQEIAPWFPINRSHKWAFAEKLPWITKTTTNRPCHARTGRGYKCMNYGRWLFENAKTGDARPTVVADCRRSDHSHDVLCKVHVQQRLTSLGEQERIATYLHRLGKREP
jgi:hypothetical protein